MIKELVDHSPVLPVLIPDLHEVRALAQNLHGANRPWHGELFGWSAEYSPKGRKKPLDSKMQFTPAEFWIGESGIWFFSMMWEHGRNSPPNEFLDDRGILAVPA